MSTHNLCFRGEIRKILCGHPILSGPMKNVTWRVVNGYQPSPLWANSAEDNLIFFQSHKKWNSSHFIAQTFHYHPFNLAV